MNKQAPNDVITILQAEKPENWLSQEMTSLYSFQKFAVYLRDVKYNQNENIYNIFAKTVITLGPSQAGGPGAICPLRPLGTPTVGYGFAWGKYL